MPPIYAQTYTAPALSRSTFKFSQTLNVINNQEMNFADVRVFKSFLKETSRGESFSLLTFLKKPYSDKNLMDFFFALVRHNQEIILVKLPFFKSYYNLDLKCSIQWFFQQRIISYSQ